MVVYWVADNETSPEKERVYACTREKDRKQRRKKKERERERE